MSGWSFETGGGNSKKQEFTKFPEGVTKIRIIDIEPVERWTHWMARDKRSINCPGKGCPICNIRKQEKANKLPYTYPMARRFALQVLNRNTNKMEIMEQGINFFQDLRDVMELLATQDKSLIDVDLQVRRRGSGKDGTSYRIDVAEEYALTAEDVKMVEEKIDLKEYFTPHTPEQITRVVAGEKFDEVMYGDDKDNSDTEEEFEVE